MTEKGSAPGRHQGVWIVDTAGGEPQSLSRAVDRNCNSGVEPFWSSDSSTVHFGVLDDGNDHLYAVAAGEGAPAAIISGERQVAWATAADGTLTFLSTDPTHPAEVFIASADGLNERQLSMKTMPGSQRWRFRGVSLSRSRAPMVLPSAPGSSARRPKRSSGAPAS